LSQKDAVSSCRVSPVVDGMQVQGDRDSQRQGDPSAFRLAASN